MKIVKDEKILRRVSTPIESVEEAERIINEIKKSLLPISYGLGLGAIQIGIPKRIAVIRRKDTFINLINPEIIEQDEKFWFINEGCLSIANKKFSTPRYKQLTIKNHYINDGEFKEETLYFYYGGSEELNHDGLTAIAIQHEIDHMNGVLISDYKDQAPVAKTEVRVDAKIGRNDPCPCGSGRKYKKCCL